MKTYVYCVIYTKIVNQISVAASEELNRPVKDDAKYVIKVVSICYAI